MKKVFLLFIVIFITQTAFTQQIKHGLFTSGAAVSNNTDFGISSNLGQLAIGVSTNSDFIISSGFYYGALLLVSSVEDEEIVPIEYKLEQNYPNPFNPSTTIKFSIPNNDQVVMKVYDIIGNEVITLINNQMEAGVYSISFDASSLASGMYIYRLKAGSFVSTKKMMLLK